MSQGQKSIMLFHLNSVQWCARDHGWRPPFSCIANPGLSWGTNTGDPENTMVDHYPALQHALVDVLMLRRPGFSTLEAQYQVFKMVRQHAIFMQWLTSETYVTKFSEAFWQLTERNFMTISAYKPRARDQTIALSKDFPVSVTNTSFPTWAENWQHIGTSATVTYKVQQ